MSELAIPENRQVVTAADFDAAMEDAKKKAVTLRRIVEDRKLFTLIQGKKYLEVEAWETIGRAYGYTAKTEWTRPVEGGGWEAKAVVIDSVGMEVGAAETECGTKGDRPWDTRPSNVQRSMAQTRAVSKALRSILSWVVVLAGDDYAVTPANEMPEEAREQQPMPQGPTEPQMRRLWAIAQAQGIDAETIKAWSVELYGVDNVRNLNRDQYNDLTARMENASNG